MFAWITQQMRNWPEVKGLFACSTGTKADGRTRQNQGKSLIQGISGAQRPLLLAAMWHQLSSPLIVITFSPTEAQRLSADLAEIIGADLVSVFPAYDLMAHEEAYEKEVAGARLSVLSRLLKGEEDLLVVTSWPALVRKVIPPEVLSSFIFHLELGGVLDRDSLLTNLVTLGYERTNKVYTLGQFSVRGDIVDIFPPDQENPVRIEFFGDEIDSIRRFEPDTQKSLENMEEIRLLPAREGLWRPEDFQKARPRMEELLQKQAERLEKQAGQKTAGLLREKIQKRLEQISAGLVFPGIDRFLPLIRDDLGPVWAYMERAFVVLDEPVRGSEYLRTVEEENSKTLGGFLERGLLLPEEIGLYYNLPDLQNGLGRLSSIQSSVLGRSLKGFDPVNTILLPIRPAPEFGGQPKRFLEEVKTRIKGKWIVGIAVSGEERLNNLREALRDEGLNPIKADRSLSPASGQVYLLDASLSTGFELPHEHLVIFSEAEVFGRTRLRKKVRTKFGKEGIRVTDITELQVGDYVVHINHGIGKYLGLKNLQIGGGNRDYLEVKYAEGDRLFVPTDQVHLLQRYVGLEDSAPKVNRLGGSEWQRAKNKVKESVAEMADKLLVLYADRYTAQGYAFPPDSNWQQEFEASFVYEETPDQLRALAEIKKDMESSRPMDRLLCGDVGYGKTEVAIRAAFKAITGGKQVAFLVPTTILAQQHFQTITQRFSGYPIKIAVLSRFQSSSEQEAIAKGLRQGTIDLVIGTHRLLSKDIVFKDLGLLIVDEEQKFGVSHKERLKELRKNVDALTLTATPIPRTLHMSLVGIRDMSVIETPPEERYPVRTYVLEFNEEIIIEAIKRELDRGGQIFFVYNRVETIERMASYLQHLITEARIEIAHGQMHEDALEDVMLSFYEGSADILLCTTIIENGLDIANVNTIIVYDADRLGLSQLYQLRGRVGRSNRVAYAYFTYRKDRVLGEAAEKRLAAIRDFTDLGSGFKIALRDLEIRGAGNLLGPEQHGHIATVGFDLYCRLLEEAIRERRGEKKPELPEPTIELSVDAYIPDNYINDPGQKVEIYKKIAAISTFEEADEVADEIEDRFGAPPAPVINLLEIARLKIYAKLLGLATIASEKGDFIARPVPGLSLNPERVASLLVNFRGEVRYQPGRQPVLRWKIAGKSHHQVWRLLKDSLAFLLDEGRSA